jgi:hypothetical protein
MRIDHATINREALSSGDEIGVFTPAGRLAGSVVWNRQAPARLVAYGDDPATSQIDGFVAGETMYFRVWDSSRNDRDYAATASFIRGDGRFGTADSAHIAALSAQTNFTRTQQLAASCGCTGRLQRLSGGTGFGEHQRRGNRPVHADSVVDGMEFRELSAGNEYSSGAGFEDRF